MARRWRILVLIAPVAVVLLVWGFDRIQTVSWVGWTNLEVEFAVTDAATGSPISNARVEVETEEDYKQSFVLTSDAGGLASKECPRSMCSGGQSGLGFNKTFVVQTPFWRYRVVAVGYDPSEWVDLYDSDLRWQVRRVGPQKAKLVVPVSLHQRQAEPGGAPDRGGGK